MPSKVTPTSSPRWLMAALPWSPMYSYDFTPIGETEPAIHKDVTYELEQYPVDET